MSDDFPDQPYLDRIRAALWQRGAHGNASVMVGAGMSLNARPRGAGSGRFPTWSDLARTVVDHLYPAHGGADSEHRNHALRQANSTSGFLRLAQEYETAFGREALERLIADAVPDLRFEPGDLHQRLLALPWSDIFTTNWDTLLERAATRVVDRHYDVVRTVTDIPGSARPRIVKLHGTLPATRPLIFTEEDFRTYPIRFAPFVNLAQQSMMENVFCLLGFSGDDPNFLYWSGWVRDHLRDYAPHIYLVGWLDLPPPRRRMLEGRGVVPIDLAHLPLQAPWPEEALGKVILPRLEPASPQISEVVEMINDLRSLDFPVEATYPALARLRPDLMPELSDRLRQSLVSSQEEQAEDGIEAVWWWLREGQQLGLGEPPPDLVREIAIAVSMRRPSLQHALRAAEWILKNGAVVEADRFARLVAEGLGYLLSTARYEAGLVQQSALRPNEIPEVRLLCVKVALALERSGFGDLHPVGEWIREGQNDPFPEVRHVLGASDIALPATDTTASPA